MELNLFPQIISEIFEFLQDKKARCALSEVFLHLPIYHDEQNLDGDNPVSEPISHNFLSDLILTNLQHLTQVAEKSIEFTADINTEPNFLQDSLCYKAIKSIKMIKCIITETDIGEIIFQGIYSELTGVEIQFSNVTLHVSSFMFFSGTVEKTAFVPKFLYDCKLKGAELPFTIEQFAGSKHYSIYDAFKKANDFSIENMLSIFGIGDIEINVPTEITACISGNLSLQKVLIDTTGNAINAFSFEITTKKPLELLDGKISFTPSLNITINYFGHTHSVNLYAYGELKIGKTNYEIYVKPSSHEISFAMKNGDILDIGAVSESFFDISLPELKIDKLFASCNYQNSTYMFELQTIDVLKFDFAAKKFLIDSIALQVWLYSNKFAVTLRGKFTICDLPLELTGSYEGDENYKFSACITKNININLSKLLFEFFGASCNLHDSLSFEIAQLVFLCATGKESSFEFCIQANFCGSDDTLKKLFAVMANINVKANKKENKWTYDFDISCGVEISGQTLNCEYKYDSTVTGGQNIISLIYSPKTAGNIVTFADILSAVGFDAIDDSWSFITEIGISTAEMGYDFSKKVLTGKIKISTGGTFEFSVTFGEKVNYSIAMSSTAVISLKDVPIAGGLTKSFPMSNNFSVKEITIYAVSEKDIEKQIPAGVRLNFTVLGEKQHWQIYEIKPANQILLTDKNTLSLTDKNTSILANNSTAPKMFWVKLEKTIAIFTLHRIGLGLDGSYLMLTLDASLNVSPLTFSLYGAGIGVNISNFDLKYYFTGFGVSFKNPTLTMSGEFKKTGSKYSGSLLIQIKQISIFAIAQYSEDTGSLFAYAVISAKMGGPPAFFITGLALGFGYNKRIEMPAIDKVADFPLIKGAMGKIKQDDMLASLDDFITDESGQKFLAFGIKFTTFEIAESFVLLMVSFGNNFEIDVLGISDITMPPKCETPIAHAQLALKASFKPDEGFLGIEARLTSESYILSKDCHLTGGFAFYMWFGDNKHSGDFVITLGGYHPKYNLTKPSHYPDVPRVGFNWNIGSHVNVCGEMYFALTPSTLMAGGRLSMTYTLGNLKAYFIAKADFLICWKPFHYDIEIGITIGGSYYVDLWFVSFTISLELGADLHIWGPEFSGTAHISFWIVSFDIAFGAKASKKAADLNWDEFCTSFLPKTNPSENAVTYTDNANNDVVPLTISFGEGLNGQVRDANEKEMKSVHSNGVILAVDTVIPIKAATLNSNNIPFSPVEVKVKPMGDNGSSLISDFVVTVKDDKNHNANFTGTIITKNMPTALWGGESELIKEVPCGILLNSVEPKITIFPIKHFISLDDLYKKGATIIENAFVYMKPTDLPSYTDKGTISIFKSTVNSPAVSSKREDFLKSLGVNISEKITLAKYAAGADAYLDEEVLIPQHE